MKDYKQIGDKIVDNLGKNLKIVDKSFLIEAFQKENFQISDEKAELLFRFYELLIRKNEVMNLTAITEFTQVVYKHFLDSVYGGRLIEDGKICCEHSINHFPDVSVIDVGTGAGFPGIPLKICYPELKITLMDSLNKRVGFLNEVIGELGLSDIQAVHSRAEDLGRNPEYREQFDFAVSRAVADLSVLSEYCLPFVKTGGAFISYKGGDVEEELNHSKKAIELLGGHVADMISFSYQIGKASYQIGKSSKLSCDTKSLCEDSHAGAEEVCQRSFIIIKKVKATAKKYPRKAGTPGKMPLGRK